jgi:small subunit ribosomal protein S2
MPYVNHRWLGGLLTNFQTISQRIKRLHDLERYEADGQLALLPTRERLAAQADLEKLRANLGGVKDLKRPPEAMFVIDLNKEAIAVKEAQRLRIPVIGLVDTNCDPDGIDYIIPGNDDAIRSCFTITKALGDVIYEGRSAWVQSETERAEREAAEAARRQAEDQARKAAEEQARRDEQARREAAVQAANTAEGGGDRAVAEAQVAEAAETIRETTQPAPHIAGHAQDENPASADRRDQPSSDVAPTADGPQQDPASTPDTPLTDVVEGGTPQNPANTETEAS